MIYNYAFHIFLVLCVVQPILTLKKGAAKPKVCQEGAMIADPYDCASYFQCLNGRIVKQECVKESYFDSVWDVCVVDADGICNPLTVSCAEGYLEQNPQNTCGYLKCLNGSIAEINCTTGYYFNSTLNTCLIDKNGVCSANPRKCIEGELRENLEDPCGYLKCVNGSFTELDCTSGSYFNSTLKICLIDEHGVCSAISDECIEGELKQNTEDPCGYLKCVNGSFAEVECPSGSYFNSTLKICLIDVHGVCSEISQNCTDGDIEENPEDPCGYLRCVNGSLAELHCPSGSYFNSTLEICLIDEHGVCSLIADECLEDEVKADPEDPCGYLRCVKGSLAEVNCPSGRYFNSTSKSCLMDASGVCSAFVESCIEGEVEEDPVECGGYLKCINGKMVNQLCSYGRYFHSVLKSCIVDDFGVCIPLSEVCEEGDRQSDAEDCTSYMECIDGDFVSQQCHEGSYFDIDIMGCIIDENGVCIPLLD